MMPCTFISQPITMITVRIFRASMTQLHPQPRRLILWITFPVNTDSTRWPFPLIWTNQTFVLWWEMKKIPSALVIWLITDRKLGVLSLSERKLRPREGLLIEVTLHSYACRLNACLPASGFGLDAVFENNWLFNLKLNESYSPFELVLFFLNGAIF